MSDQTSPDAGAVASEAPNPEVEQDKATTPEVDTQATTEDTTAEAKTFTQDELNDIVKKEKARAEAKAERRVMKALERLTPQQAAQQQVQAPVDTRPSRRQGEADDDYVERLTDWKLDQRDRAGNQQRAQEQTRTLEAKTADLYAQASKVAGFDREDFDSLPLTPILAKAVVESDLGPKLMVFMAANPEEVTRIAALSEVRQAAEIGKLETRLSASNPSRAPSPITPIGSRGSAVSNLESASLADYEKLRAQQGAPWARR